MANGIGGRHGRRRVRRRGRRRGRRHDRRGHNRRRVNRIRHIRPAKPRAGRRMRHVRRMRRMRRVRLMLREHHAVAGLVHGEAHKLRVARQLSLGLRLDPLLRLLRDLSPIRACRVRDWRRGPPPGPRGQRAPKRGSGFLQSHALPPLGFDPESTAGVNSATLANRDAAIGAYCSSNKATRDCLRGRAS